MDEIEIQVFDEINDYKEKFYGLTLRQWIFIVLIAAICVPMYLFLPKFVGEDIASYIVIIVAGILGFVGFVKIHNLPAEKLIPYLIRHYFVFNKKITYMSEEEYKELKDKKKQKQIKKVKVKEQKQTKQEEKQIQKAEKRNAAAEEKKQKEDQKLQKREMKKNEKQQKELEKAKRKYGHLFEKSTDSSQNEPQVNVTLNSSSDELSKKIDNLTEEQKKVLLDLIGK